MIAGLESTPAARETALRIARKRVGHGYPGDDVLALSLDVIDGGGHYERWLVGAGFTDGPQEEW